MDYLLDPDGHYPKAEGGEAHALRLSNRLQNIVGLKFQVDSKQKEFSFTEKL
jgi:hypothetical protein